MSEEQQSFVMGTLGLTIKYVFIVLVAILVGFVANSLAVTMGLLTACIVYNHVGQKKEEEEEEK